eukprot:215222-Alexandrium_andersonii.AAC.1
MTRDQKVRLGELHEAGVEVVLLQGREYSPEYRAVGRDFRGLAHAHAKMLCADDCAIIGSCNWTTASRANHEIG